MVFLKRVRGQEKLVFSIFNDFEKISEIEKEYLLTDQLLKSIEIYNNNIFYR